MTATTARKPIDMVTFMAWLPTFGRKFEVADVQRQPRLYQAAIEYARSYTGDFSYMVEMKTAALRFNSLTVGQAKGVLNCARAEALRNAPKVAPATVEARPAKRGITVEPMSAHDDRFQAMLDREMKSAYASREAEMEAEAYRHEMESERAAEAAMSAHAMGFRPERIEAPEGPEDYEAYDPQYNAPAPAAPIENGTYTVVFGDESDRITLRISDPKWMTENPDSVQAVAYLYGPDNSNDYKGIGFLKSHGVAIWRSVRPTISAEFEARINEALRIIGDSDQAELREAYALRSGRCARCGRKLTVPASIHRGVGPECAKHYL